MPAPPGPGKSPRGPSEWPPPEEADDEDLGGALARLRGALAAKDGLIAGLEKQLQRLEAASRERQLGRRQLALATAERAVTACGGALGSRCEGLQLALLLRGWRAAVPSRRGAPAAAARAEAPPCAAEAAPQAAPRAAPGDLGQPGVVVEAKVWARALVGWEERLRQDFVAEELRLSGLRCQLEQQAARLERQCLLEARRCGPGARAAEAPRPAEAPAPRRGAAALGGAAHGAAATTRAARLRGVEAGMEVRRGAADRERLVRAVLSWLRGCELQRLARRHAAEAEQQSAKHAMLQDQALLLRRSLGDACSLASASQERLWRVRCWALLRRREAEVLMRLGSF